VPPGEGKCEYDVYRNNMAGAVSLNLRLGTKSTSDLLAGRVTPAQVLSPSQVRYLRAVVGTWPLPSGIRKLGPMQVQTYHTRGKLGDIDDEESLVRAFDGHDALAMHLPFEFVKTHIGNCLCQVMVPQHPAHV